MKRAIHVFTIRITTGKAQEAIVTVKKDLKRISKAMHVLRLLAVLDRYLMKRQKAASVTQRIIGCNLAMGINVPMAM